MPRIFVSHAAKDEALVEEFVELLQVGVGIHPDDVFCSSLPGMDIPTGSAFIEYIKSQVQNPELVILVISTEFLKSQFCHNEVGATWALSLPVFPILVPPVEYGDVRGVLFGTQASRIEDKEKLNDLRGDLTERLKLAPLRTSHWERKRDKFLVKLASLLQLVKVEDEHPAVASSKPIAAVSVISSSGSWLKLDERFYETERFERHGKSKISIRVTPSSAEDEAALEHLRSFVEGRTKATGFAYQNDGAMIRIDKMSSVSQAGSNHWAIEITLVEDSGLGFMSEMNYNQYSTDDIAEMRAGRLLINNPPPPRRRSGVNSDSFLESIIAGRSDSPVQTGECVIRTVVQKYRIDLQQALIRARLEAIFRLKAAQIVGSIFELALGPVDGDKLHVRFRGQRPRRNQGEEPEMIAIEGECDLA